jgi:GNAT superfamily N-acetyltransferase
MALAAFWQGDPLPSLAPLPGFRAEQTDDIALIARLARLAPAEVRRRMDTGHRAYVGYLNDVPAAYGWVAGMGAEIGELGVAFVLPAGDRYLWDFATLPEWRGRGIYPHLLRAIIAGEMDAQRLWIIHAPENVPSCKGIARAGFVPVGELSFRAVGDAGFIPYLGNARPRVGAALLGVPLLDPSQPAPEPLAPCWHCPIAAATAALRADTAACWPDTAETGATRSPACTCAAG